MMPSANCKDWTHEESFMHFSYHTQHVLFFFLLVYQCSYDGISLMESTLCNPPMDCIYITEMPDSSCSHGLTKMEGNGC